jgi:indole-3-glycerol phosphate synthase
MPAYLDEILDATRERISGRRSSYDLERQIEEREPPRGFLAEIRMPGMSLVAEVKRRSPSRGAIREEADPATVAAAYERGGAAALSVLTEPHFFGGSIDDLVAARAACSLPVLRKDFLIDPYQMLESRAAGADAVLVIVAALPDPARREDMIAAARELGLDVLVEAHDEREVDGALESGADLIGINQRDLRTFEIDRGLAARLRKAVPPGVAVIAESGVSTRDEVRALEEAGLDGVLVGEALMRSGDPEAAAAALTGRDERADGEDDR